MFIRIALLSLLASASFAAGSSIPSLSAAQIIERNANARGGAAAWEKVRSMTLSGKLDAGKVRKDGGAFADQKIKSSAQRRADMRAILDGKAKPETPKIIQLPFKMDLARPIKSRLEIPFQGATAVQVFDGRNGWKVRPYLGRHEVEAFSSDEMRIASSQQPLDGPLMDHVARGTKIVADGTENVDGHQTYRLKLTLKSGDVRHVWIDAKTFLEAKIDGPQRRFNGKMHPVVTFYRDYKAVDGLMIAHRLETRMEGTPGAENIYVERVALNPPLDASTFAKPM